MPNRDKTGRNGQGAGTGRGLGGCTKTPSIVTPKPIGRAKRGSGNTGAGRGRRRGNS